MPVYQIAGQSIFIQYTLAELKAFQIEGDVQWADISPVSDVLSFTQREQDGSGNYGVDLQAEMHKVNAWISGTDRLVSVVEDAAGTLLAVEGAGKFLISQDGHQIIKAGSSQVPDRLDCEIITGLALVLALSIMNVWSLHASAVKFKDQLIILLGDSGSGKSTLASWLASCGWDLVADDILPVSLDPTKMIAWSHFPQLKISPGDQPGPLLPERIPVGKILELSPAGMDDHPEVQLLSLHDSTRSLLAHTAGSRLFSAGTLGRHLDFCGQAASLVPGYRLVYPHNKKALPAVRELLEKL